MEEGACPTGYMADFGQVLHQEHLALLDRLAEPKPKT